MSVATLLVLLVSGVALGAPAGDEQDKTFLVTDDLLLLPIENGAAKAQVSLFVDGKRVRHLNAELAGNAG